MNELKIILATLLLVILLPVQLILILFWIIGILMKSIGEKFENISANIDDWIEHKKITNNSSWFYE